MRYEDLEQQPCSILRPLALLGDRWTLAVLRQAFSRVRRFEDFQTTLGLSRSVLSDRLDRLVAAGILNKHAYRDTHRTRHEYHLTNKGLDLYPVLTALRTWGDKYMAPQGPFAHYRHRHCGGDAEIHLTCSRCEQELSARDIELEMGPGLDAYAS
ncbi:winged helix-turn-helix transcriptional regulator [Nocardia terpenica]|uniref:Transcriptional regulator n=1 Tax=Nocardia terpenica TaxID=455432 RepID=A0A6G9YYQ1_9NOCA|nr:helix-turn-helix domain-containing protein [Nocardia terpenica]QIS18332.1 transcriptional regulator [Nocardia terpenica]